MNNDVITDRKNKHIDIVLKEQVEFGTNGFEKYKFPHKALPEIDFSEIDTSTTFLGKKLSAPILISCMTGGTRLSEKINVNLAKAAQKFKIAMGVGSQRKAIEDPSFSYTYKIRKFCPDIPLVANLGAVQLNYGFGLKEAKLAIKMIDADALALHLNPLQEAIQPEGNYNFKGLFPKIKKLVKQIDVPIIAKEVGNGISYEIALQLYKIGVRIVDTAGSGGTSWAAIEAKRSRQIKLGMTFSSWGITTAESIQQCRKVPGLFLIGSGGIRNGVEIAKAIVLGADLVGVGLPLLRAASNTYEEVVKIIDEYIKELKIAMFCSGVNSIKELKKVKLLVEEE